MKRTLNFKILLSMVLMLLCGQHLIAQCLGGAISTSNNQSMIYTCPGDGQSDLVVFQNTGSQDTEYTYLVTDQNDVILEIVDGDSFDFENAPIGECHVWGVGYTGNFLAQPGQSVFGNMFSDDCYNISYKCITVFRVEVDGGNVSLTHEGGDVANICLNDGGSDIVSFSTTSTSAQYTYVVTDENNNILAIPEFNYADFGSAPVGICRVWGLSYTGSLIAQAGQNAATVELADNCFDLSDNFITVYRNEADGGTVAMPDGQTYRELCTTGSQTIVGLSNTSTTSADYIYLITDAANNFLQAVDADTYDFAGVPDGTCRVWGLSHTGNLVLQQGSSVFSSPITDGCWEISSTAITVVRTSVEGGTLEGGPFEFIVDGTPDFVSGITLSGNAGTNQAWVITDEQGNILGLPLMPGVVDFDGAGAGVCLIWSLSFEDGLQGAEVGMNANDLVGCYSLSNPITVTRLPEGPSVNGGTLAGGPFEFCVDGESDFVSGITLSGNTGTNSAWVITDDQGNILGLPPMPGVVDFDGAGAGVCLIWHLSFEDGLQGAEVGMNAADLVGDFDLSNSITVTRNEAIGGTLEGGPFEFIVDGTPDFVSGITLSGNAGTNQAWVITDEQGNILGLPPMPGVVDFDGAGAGVCLIWSLSFEDGLQGAEVGMNANDLVGCYSLSNPITVTRLPEGPSVGGIVINEINGNDRFEIKNTGNTTVDISNYWICDFPSYSVLSSLDIECDADLVLDPDEVITLVSNFDISGDDGEFGLYLNTSWSDPNSIIDYVEWGSSGHTRANVAIAAGIWSSADFVPAFPNPMSIHYDGTGNDASDWSVAMFSPCESLIENDDETELQRVAIQDMTAYPNPTKEVVMMTLDYMRDNEVEAQVSLLNSQGQVVQSKRMNLVPGNNQIEMSLSNYPGGIYLLDVRAENIHETIRIVKQQM